MTQFILTLATVIFFGAQLFADVEMVRFNSGEKPINVLKGLSAVPKTSRTSLPDLKIGFYRKTNEIKKSYLTCETHNGQKFSEGEFGYAGCLNEKRDQVKTEAVGPATPSSAPPTLESLRFNVDHTFSF